MAFLNGSDITQTISKIINNSTLRTIELLIVNLLCSYILNSKSKRGDYRY